MLLPEPLLDFVLDCPYLVSYLLLNTLIQSRTRIRSTCHMAMRTLNPTEGYTHVHRHHVQLVVVKEFDVVADVLHKAHLCVVCTRLVFGACPVSWRVYGFGTRGYPYDG